MAAGDVEARTEKTNDTPPRRSPFGHALSIVLRLAVLAAIAFAMFALGGFLRFANSLSTIEVPKQPTAHGIVVLTGGSQRIQVAVDLLQKNAAGRLLISGVNTSTTIEQLAKVTGAPVSLFETRVDLDHRAANTTGNAHEIAAWAKKNKYEALIVVTSAYHMPRSMTELKYALPEGFGLTPYPVSPEDLDLSSWYTDFGTIRLLFSEYAKFMLVKFRHLTAGLAGGKSETAG